MRTAFSPRRHRSFWLHWFAIMFVFGLMIGLVGGLRAAQLSVRGSGPRVPIWREDLGRVVEEELEQYLIGVVAAEMPARFHIEALKAQAVAARTFAIYALQTGRRVPQHPRAVFSTDHRNGQAWRSLDSLRETWGWTASYWYAWKVSQAVLQTRGEILTYRGDPIEALYHSTSGGHTESAGDYFRSHRPYLQGVPDPYSEQSPHHQKEVIIPRERVREALGVQGPWRIVATTETGRVRTLAVDGREFSGREVRERLGLPSTWFTVEETEDGYRFIVRGYGHGVGMSQYGADGMARAGYSYREILAHYYPGTELTRLY